MQSRDWSVGTSKNMYLRRLLIITGVKVLHKLLQAGRKEGLTGCSNLDSTRATKETATTAHNVRTSNALG